MQSQSVYFSKKVRLGPKVAMLSLLSCALIFADAKTEFFARFKSVALEFARPIQLAANAPKAWGADAREALKSREALLNENVALRDENFELKAQLAQRQNLLAELRELKDLANLADEGVKRVAIANVVSQGRDPALNKLIIDKGAKDGVEIGMAALHGEGMVGQVTSVQRSAAEIGLLGGSDVTMPVMVARTGVRTLLYGENGMLNLRYFPVNQDLRLNDLLVTSGVDDQYEAGIPIAKITTLTKNFGDPYYKVKIEPLVDAASVSRVMIIPLKKPLLDFDPIVEADRGRRALSEAERAAQAAKAAPSEGPRANAQGGKP